MTLKAKDGKKYCPTCKVRKCRQLFHKHMQQTCLECLDGRTPEEFREWRRKEKNKKREVYRKRQRGKLLATIGNAKDKRGYIYLMHSIKEDFYKIGVSTDPYKRLKDLRISDYGIRDLKLLAISIPVDEAYKTERYVHNKLKRYNVEFTKVNGRKATELYKCDNNLIVSLFYQVSQDIKIIEYDKFKNINLNKINKINKFPDTPAEKKIIKRMQESVYNSHYRDIFNFSHHHLYVKCYSNGNRLDHLIEAIFKKGYRRKEVSLGLFKDGNEALKNAREFSDFYESECADYKTYLNSLWNKYNLHRWKYELYCWDQRNIFAHFVSDSGRGKDRINT